MQNQNQNRTARQRLADALDRAPDGNKTHVPPNRRGARSVHFYKGFRGPGGQPAPLPKTGFINRSKDHR